MASEVELSDLTSPRTAGGDTKASGESQDVVLSRGGESKRGGKFSRTVIKATNAIDLAHLSLEAEVNSRLDAKSRPAASYFKQFKIDWSDMPGTGNDLDSIPWVVAESVRASQNRNIRTSVRVRDLHYGGRTLGMNIHHPFRKFCIDVVEHPIFEKLILALIVLNCVVIAFESEQSESRVGGWESITQTVCTVLFFIELIMKVIAMGFMLNGKGSYLRNPWNIIDFLAVLFGFLLFLPTFGSNLTVIRSVRVLRPLRTVSSSQGMRMMVLSLVSSLPRLSNVFLLLIFAFFIFGIVGMQAFGGLFRRRCYDPSTNFFYSDDMCGPYDVCNGNQTCSDSGANPNRGATGFDNFAQACLTILVCLSLEGWYEIQEFAIEVTSGASVIYFSLLIVTCAFFVMNLVIAVVFAAYDRQRKLAQYGLRSTKRQNEINQTNERIHANMIAFKLTQRQNGPASSGELRESKSGKDSAASVSSAASEMWALALAHSNKHATIRKHEREMKQETKPDYSDYDLTTCLGRSRTSAAQLAMSQLFRNTVTVAIIINTILLASEYHGQTAAHTEVLRVSNIILTVFFTLEIVIKVHGFGWSRFIVDGFNQFDFLIVVLSVIEVAITESGVRSNSGISAFRAFRLLRVFRLAKDWGQLNRLLDAIAESFRSLTYFGFLLVLFMFMFALLGIQFFKDKLNDENGERSRANFDNFGWSMITVFQVIGGENWNAILYDAMASVGWYSAFYFVSLYALGHYLLLSLFLGILLSHFESKGIGADAGEGKVQDVESDTSDDDEMEAGYTIQEDKSHGNDGKGDRKDRRARLPRRLQSGMLMGRRYSYTMTRGRGNSNSTAATATSRKLDGYGEDVKSVRRKTLANVQGVGVFAQTKRKRKRARIKGVSLYLFGPENPVRRFAHATVVHPWFDHLMLAFIIFVSMCLTLDQASVDEQSRLGRFLHIVNILSAVIFNLEMVLKVVAWGLYFNEGAYLRDGWNVIDMIVAVTSILDVAVPASQTGVISALRVLRALRPVKLVSQSENMQVVLAALMASVPKIARVFLISCLFYLVFGILGVQLFSGLMYRCQLATDEFDVALVDKSTCLGLSGYEWVNPSYANFDDIGHALLTLFEVGSLEGWPLVMYRAVDISGEDQAPQRDNNQPFALYFVAFIIVGNFLVNNLFVGVVISSFTSMKERLLGHASLSESQKVWLEINHMLLFVELRAHHKPPQGSSWWARMIRTPLFRLATNVWFDLAISMLIILNIIVMAMWFYQYPSAYGTFLDTASYTFTALFVIEAIIKIVGLGPTQYFSVRWNAFDFLIVLGSVIGIPLSTTFDPTVLRIFRTARIVRVVKSVSGLKSLFASITIALAPLANVGGLVALFLFVFSIMAMHMFGQIAWDDQGYINRYSNFDTFPIAMLTLFRCATGEDWNKIMDACRLRRGSECTAQNCGTNAAYPFFIFYVIGMQFMLLNLFVAVVLDHFRTAGESEDTETLVDVEDINTYAQAWSRYVKLPPWWRFWDTYHMWLPYRDFCDLVVNLEGTLSMGQTRIEREEVLRTLQIPCHYRPLVRYVVTPGGQLSLVEEECFCIHYYDGLIGLVLKEFERQQRSLDELLTIPKYVIRYKIIQKTLRRRFRELHVREPVTALDEMLAAIRIQSAFRGRRTRKKLRRVVRAYMDIMQSTAKVPVGRRKKQRSPRKPRSPMLQGESKSPARTPKSTEDQRAAVNDNFALDGPVESAPAQRATAASGTASPGPRPSNPASLLERKRSDSPSSTARVLGRSGEKLPMVDSPPPQNPLVGFGGTDGPGAEASEEKGGKGGGDIGSSGTSTTP